MSITKPGDYLTRDGTRVTIREIKGPSTWPCKGAVWRMFRGKYVPEGHAIWKTNGQYLAVGEHRLDLIEQEEGDSICRQAEETTP